ncbi:SMI1/KNR4 family protein [Rhodospirillum sp. A1_3_36]|uniref:SMI1/KNR4 family protein n=1 Tax=Rhodospirillum sp. A1_3_36 TaxID=3391666 RepID=UPI0039A4BF14
MNEKLNSILRELKSVRLNLSTPQYLPSDELIDEYESEIGIVFPEDYRSFLKEASDSMLNGKDALRLTPNRSHPRELSVALMDARQIGLPKDWLPICEDNGNYFCLTPDQKIRFWDHNGSSDESWPDLATWIKDVWIDEK